MCTSNVKLTSNQKSGIWKKKKKTIYDLTSVVERVNVFKDTLFGVIKYKSPENMKTHCHASNNLSWILGNLTKLKYLGQERYKNRYT